MAALSLFATLTLWVSSSFASHLLRRSWQAITQRYGIPHLPCVSVLTRPALAEERLSPSSIALQLPISRRILDHGGVPRPVCV